MFAAFFLLARVISVAFIALQALAGIMMLTHGMKLWVRNNR